MKESGTQEEAAIVQRVMAHSSKTAERAYVRTNLTKLGSQALNIIERVTAEKESNGGQKGDTSAATSTLERSASVETVAPPEEHDDDEDSEDHNEKTEPVEATEMSAAFSCSVSLLSSVVVPPTPSRGLTEKQKAPILRVFHAEITVGTKVSKATAQNRCCTTAVLAVLGTSMNKVKQVVNHVNYLIESRPRNPPKKLEEPSTSKVHGWPDSFDDPSTRSSGKRQEWDEDDSKAIEKAFKKYPTLPSTTEIRGVFKQDTKLYTILNREGWTRAYTKVKNIFKKRSKK